MKDQIAKTKQFVKDHRVSFAVGTGVVIGVAGTIVIGSQVPTFLHTTNEQLEHLIQHPEGAIRFKGTLKEIWITTQPAPGKRYVFNY